MTDSIGKLFTDLYVEKPSPARDKATFRNRLKFYLDHDIDRDLIFNVGRVFEKRTGIEVPRSMGYYQFSDLLTKLPLNDFLNAITIVYHGLKNGPSNTRSINWQKFVATAIEQQSMAYTIDNMCVMHPLIDSAFAETRELTVRGLNKPRYTAASDLFTKGMEAFRGDDYRQSIRLLFEAIETVFLLTIDNKTNTMGSNDPVRYLKPLLAGNPSPHEQRATDQTIEGFKTWVMAGMQYRHGAGEEQIVAPPQELTVLLMQNGSAFLRWLIEIDQRKHAAPAN